MGFLSGIIRIDQKQITKSEFNTFLIPLDSIDIDNRHVILNRNYGGVFYSNNVYFNDELNKPVENDKFDLVIFADAYLTNATTLIKQLNLDKNNLLLTTPTQLILHAYIKWGKECVNYLEGEFVFVIYHIKTQTIFVARDHYGQYILHYFLNENVFSFSTKLNSFNYLDDYTNKINKKKMAQVIVQLYMNHEESCYENIFRIPAASYFSIVNKHKNIIKYWRPENFSPIIYRNSSEYIDHFKELFLAIVESRLNSPFNIGSFLSGGMDSGAIANIASNHLSKKNKTLHSFTSVQCKQFQNKFDIDKEQKFANYTIAKHQNIHPHYIESTNENMIRNLSTRFNHGGAPTPHEWSALWFNKILFEAKEHNIKTMLTGDGGNLTASYNGMNSYYEMWKNAKFIQLLDSLKIEQKKHSRGLLKLFIWHVVRYYMPTTLQNLIHRKKLNIASKYDMSPLNDMSYRQYQINDLIQQHPWVQYKLPNKNSKQYRVSRLFLGAGSEKPYNDSTWQSLYQIKLVNPMLDKRLIEFCLSIPETEYQQRGEDRLIFRQAMKGILPEKVRNNPSILGQSADWSISLTNSLNDFKNEWELIKQCDLAHELLDLPHLEKLLNSVFLDKNSQSLQDWQYFGLLTRGISYGKYLLYLENL